MGIAIAVDGSRFEVPDFETWTGEEIVAIERDLGMDLATIKNRQGSAAYAFLWVARHRGEPQVTIADCLKIPYGMLTVVDAEDDALPPAGGAAGAETAESSPGLPSETEAHDPSGPPPSTASTD